MTDSPREVVNAEVVRAALAAIQSVLHDGSMPAPHRVSIARTRVGRLIEQVGQQRRPGPEAIMCGGEPTDRDRAVVAAMEEGMRSVPDTYRSSMGASQIWVEGFIAGRTA